MESSRGKFWPQGEQPVGLIRCGHRLRIRCAVAKQLRLRVAHNVDRQTQSTKSDPELRSLVDALSISALASVEGSKNFSARSRQEWVGASCPEDGRM